MGRQTLLLHISCSALSVARRPALLIGKIPALLLGFSLVVSSSLHGLLFIHRRPPPASTYDCSPTGSCSSNLHCALLHRLMFNHPSPWGPVQPPLHGLLFIQPSTSYCSTFPPRGPIHPAVHGVLFIHAQPARSIGVLFIQRQRHGVLFIHPHCSLFIQTPRLRTTHCSSRGSIDRLQLAAVAKESLDRSGSVTCSL